PPRLDRGAAVDRRGGAGPSALLRRHRLDRRRHRHGQVRPGRRHGARGHRRSPPARHRLRRRAGTRGGSAADRPRRHLDPGPGRPGRAGPDLRRRAARRVAAPGRHAPDAGRHDRARSDPMSTPTTGGSTAPAGDTAPGPDALLSDPGIAGEALATMWRIRLFEEAVEDLYGRGMMHGTMHLSIGMEAVPTGTCLNLEQGDQITSTHRGHGHCIARGADLGRMMAELLAKDNGYCRGRGGSMHIADVATGNLGANGIVAGGVPIAAGAGLTNQLTGNGRVALCFHGDGAVGEGAWHEALTLASMWDLPVVFVCENNQYGMSMSSKKAFKVEDLAEKAAGYGIPGESVDGNDVHAVAEATRRAIDRARAGEGPSFVEAVTYRWRGHSKSDKNRYRT